MYEPPPSNLLPGSIVDTYLRDSGNEKQDRSVHSQLTEVQAYCQTHQLILRKIYKDTRSGKSIVGRKDFERMIDDYLTQTERPRGLLLWDYARFARNAKDAIFNIALIEDQDIIVHSLTDQIPDGEFKDLIRYVKHLGNETERKKNAAAVKRELHQLLLTTKAMFGNPPQGIKRQPIAPILNPRTGKMRQLNKWIPDPEWQHRIRQAYEMKAAGRPLAEIHDATHIFTGLSQYHRFFSNKIYIGILEYGGIVIADYCEPTVDRKTWDAVQYIQARHAHHQNLTAGNKYHPRRMSATANYLLSGIAHCGRCDAPLYGLSAKQRNGTYYLRYNCTRAKNERTCDFNPVPAAALEEEVINKLIHFFEHPGNLQAILDEDRKQLEQLEAQSSAQLRELNKRLRLIRKSITNVTDTIADLGTKKSKALTTKLELLELDETKLLTDIESLKANSQQPKANSQPLTASEIAFFSKRLVARLHTHDRSVVRNLLRGTIDKLTVDRTPQHAFGIIHIHSPREPEDEESFARITVPKPLPPMGAPLHRRSITFTFVIASRGHKRPGS